MARLLRKIVPVALVLCSAKFVAAQAQNLSADDTVAYINATLHKYPTLEYAESGCPADEQVLSISSDRRSLVIKQNFGQAAVGTCGDIQTLVVPVFSLDADFTGSAYKHGQDTLFRLDCINGVSCFSRHSDAQKFPLSESRWALKTTLPSRASNQLTKALKHLQNALLTEANARLDSNDPFAKHSH